MKLRVRVDITSRLWDGGAEIEVPDMLQEAFLPLKTCDEPLISYITGDTVATSMEAKRAVKLRDDAAKILEMKKKDTYNGYLKEQSKGV